MENKEEHLKQIDVVAIAKEMNCSEAELSKFTRIKHEGDYLFFTFQKGVATYRYNEQEKSIAKLWRKPSY